MHIYLFIIGAAVLLAGGCNHGSRVVREESRTDWVNGTAYDNEFEESVRSKCTNSASARIWALINNGQFAEAEALIVEAKASGLIAAPTAKQMLEKIAMLNMRVGQLPATLQRARDFPSQLKDFTLFEVRQMLERKDFSLATEAQLKMVSKLLKNPDRLMEKL